MNLLKENRLRIGLAILAIAIASIAFGWFPHKSTTTTTTPASSTVTKAPDPATTSTIDAGVFTYSKPAGWATITKTVLDTSGAVTGIGRTSTPTTTLLIKVSDSVPKNNDELVNSVLSAHKLLQNFQLISSVTTKVNGQSGQKFTYSYAQSTDTKLTQQMNVVVYKQKTYIILFSSLTPDYNQQTADFAKILDSFKFK